MWVKYLTKLKVFFSTPWTQMLCTSFIEWSPHGKSMVIELQMLKKFDLKSTDTILQYWSLEFNS